MVSLAKNRGVAVILVGHVTKEGAVAGPRSLEHLVESSSPPTTDAGTASAAKGMDALVEALKTQQEVQGEYMKVQSDQFRELLDRCGQTGVKS